MAPASLRTRWKAWTGVTRPGGYHAGAHTRRWRREYPAACDRRGTAPAAHTSMRAGSSRLAKSAAARSVTISLKRGPAQGQRIYMVKGDRATRIGGNDSRRERRTDDRAERGLCAGAQREPAGLARRHGGLLYAGGGGAVCRCGSRSAHPDHQGAWSPGNACPPHPPPSTLIRPHPR